MGLDNYPLRTLTDEEHASARIVEGGVKTNLLFNEQAKPGQVTIQVPVNGAEALVFGPFDTEEEARTHIDGRQLSTNTVDPALFEGLPGAHVIGMFGGPGWIRGKVYDPIVEQLTGRTLYEDLSADDVKEIADKLAAIDRPPADVEPDEFSYIKAYFKVLADNEFRLAAWS